MMWSSWNCFNTCKKHMIRWSREKKKRAIKKWRHYLGIQSGPNRGGGQRAQDRSSQVSIHEKIFPETVNAKQQTKNPGSPSRGEYTYSLIGMRSY